jgi:hypothetical protein
MGASLDPLPLRYLELVLDDGPGRFRDGSVIRPFRRYLLEPPRSGTETEHGGQISQFNCTSTLPNDGSATRTILGMMSRSSP